MACQLTVFVHPKQVFCIQQERSLVHLSQSALLRVQGRGNSINIRVWVKTVCTETYLRFQMFWIVFILKKNKTLLILHSCYKNLLCLCLSKIHICPGHFIALDINNAMTPYVSCRNPACPPMLRLRKSLPGDLGQDKEQMTVSLSSCRMWV